MLTPLMLDLVHLRNNHNTINAMVSRAMKQRPSWSHCLYTPRETRSSMLPTHFTDLPTNLKRVPAQTSCFHLICLFKTNPERGNRCSPFPRATAEDQGLREKTKKNITTSREGDLPRPCHPIVGQPDPVVIRQTAGVVCALALPLSKYPPMKRSVNIDIIGAAVTTLPK